MAECRDIVKKLAGKDFTEEEVDKLMNDLEKEKEDAIAKNAIIHDDLKAKGNEIFKDEEDSLRQQEFLAYRKLEIKAQALQEIQLLKKRKDPIREWVLQKIGSTESGLRGSRFSTENREKSLQISFGNSFTNELEKEGLYPIFNSREAQVAFGDAIKGLPVKDPRMQRVGEITQKYYKQSEELYKRNGVFFRDLEDRITRNYHDSVELMKTHDNPLDALRFRREVKGDSPAIFEKAFQRWKDFIYRDSRNTLLDNKRTFGKILDEAGREKFLRESFKTLTNNGNPYKQSLNIVEKSKRSKVIFFKDSESTVEYNAKMGAGTLQDAVLRDFMRTSKDIALLEDWGPNPKAMLKSILQATEQEADLKFKFGKRSPLQLGEMLLSDLDGSLDTPAGLRSAWGSNLRAFTNITKLGSVLPTSIADLAPISLELARVNGGFLKAGGDAVVSLMKGKNAADKKIMGDIVGSYNNVLIGNSARWFGTKEQLGIKMAKAQRLFFKLSGLQWWDYSNRAGMGAALGRHLAINRNISFKSLGKEDQRIFGLYDIQEAEWETLRSFPTREADGKFYLAPDGVKSIPNAELAKILRKTGVKKVTKFRIDRFKDDIERKFGAYFEDRIDHGILRPGVRDRQIFFQGTPSGSFWGQIARFTAHYKLYGTAFMSKPLAKLIYGQGAESFWEAMVQGKADLRGLAQLTAYGMFLGYIGNSIKNISRNQTLDDPFKPQTWMKAYTAGGGFGPYNDVIFNNFNQFGHDPLSRALGPDISTVAEAVKIISGTSAAIAGRTVGQRRPPKFPTNQAFHFVKKNIPFSNMFYYKTVFDWLIWDHIQNSIEPGYKRRQLNRLRKEGKNYLIN